MSQQAAERPIPNLQRKAAIAYGGAVDHRGKVRSIPIEGFDLDRTIFKTLEGRLPRYYMRTRIAKEPLWSEQATRAIESAYSKADSASSLPKVDPKLLEFMEKECDFDVEHADGSFLDHLYFCFEYGALHYKQRSPIVLFLHSILGTGTNTFAMHAAKIPMLRALLSDFDWKHIEAFPSILRLLYDRPLRSELRKNVTRLGSLREIRFHRVIDNAPLVMSSEDLLIQLNYQLVHLLDFLPVADWARHANDNLFIVFRDLYDLLVRAGRLEAHLNYEPTHERWIDGAPESVASLIASAVPSKLTENLSASSVRRFSERIGHSMEYQLVW